MNSNFHYPMDLNEDQNHQPFFYSLGSSLNQASYSSSESSSSLSYLPMLIHSQQNPIGYNSANLNGDHHHLSQSLQAKMLMSNGESSCDHMVPKKETRLKLTIRKKQERTDSPPQSQTKQDQSDSSPTHVKWMSSKMRPMITDNEPMDQHDDLNIQKTSPEHSTVVFESGYNGNNNNGVIRVCSDCNTTKTPLWRSGPRGPKSLCNACGIRQRKARRAAMAAVTTGAQDSPAEQPPQLTPAKKKKFRNKNVHKRSCEPSKAKKFKMTATTVIDSDTQSKSSSSSSSNKFGFDDLTTILSKSSAFQQVFPQDEKEAAVLLMALSYGMVHG